MTDIVERAEKLLQSDPYHAGRVAHDLYLDRAKAMLALAPKLIAELKAARAERINAHSLSEDVIAHVLADIDQASNEDQWSLRTRLEVIQKICDGNEYTNA